MKIIRKMLSAFLTAAVIIGTICTGAITAGAETASDYKVSSKNMENGSYCVQVTTASFFTIDLTAYRLTDHTITAEYFCDKNTYKFTLDYIDRFPYPIFHINDEMSTDKNLFDYSWDTTWVDGEAINSDIFLYAKTSEYIKDLKTCSSVRITCGDKVNTRVMLEDTTIELKKNAADDSSEQEPEIKDVSSLSFHNIKNYTYTGSNRKSTITVKDGNYTLVKGVDYTLKYKNCKNIGTASVTVIGKGDYTGEKTLTYKILPKKTTLSSKKIDKDTAKLWWKKTAGAEKYEIFYSKNGGQYKKLATVSSGKRTVTLSGFNFEKYSYKFKVRAYAVDDGEYYYSSLSEAVKVK